jgi:hypothetical protein
MIKTQVCFPAPDLRALRRAAKQAGKSVSEMIREAVRRTWLQAPPKGPVALWDGKARPSIDHDSCSFGLDAGKPPTVRDLQNFAGTWVEDRNQSRALGAQRPIDRELWQRITRSAAPPPAN